MNIVQPHRTISKEVTKWKEIKDEVMALKVFIAEKNYTGKWKDCHALHHSQVSEAPFNFFVFNEAWAKVKFLPSLVIINPTVIWTGERKYKPKEGCMSYPFRDTIRVKRFERLKVSFQIPGLFGRLVKKELECEGLLAEIMQHEMSHAKAIYIYDKN